HRGHYSTIPSKHRRSPSGRSLRWPDGHRDPVSATTDPGSFDRRSNGANDVRISLASSRSHAVGSPAMLRHLVLSLALLSGFVAPARAYDIFPSVSGYAYFINADDSKTELINSGDVTPGGGRAYDFHQFGNGGALCTTYTGQVDWLCASSS